MSANDTQKSQLTSRMSALKGKENMLRTCRNPLLGVKQRHMADAGGRAVSDDYLKSISIPISPGFPQPTAPWVTGALVQTPDIMAVEALPSHLHPCTKRADGWELFDREANGLCCGAKAM